jgi:hypothetical protein
MILAARGCSMMTRCMMRSRVESMELPRQFLLRQRNDSSLSCLVSITAETRHNRGHCKQTRKLYSEERVTRMYRVL